MAAKEQRSTKEKKKPKADVKSKPVSAYKAAMSGGPPTIGQPPKK